VSVKTASGTIASTVEVPPVAVAVAVAVALASIACSAVAIAEEM